MPAEISHNKANFLFDIDNTMTMSLVVHTKMAVQGIAKSNLIVNA